MISSNIPIHVYSQQVLEQQLIFTQYKLHSCHCFRFTVYLAFIIAFISFYCKIRKKFSSFFFIWINADAGALIHMADNIRAYNNHVENEIVALLSAILLYSNKFEYWIWNYILSKVSKHSHSSVSRLESNWQTYER